MDLLLDKIKIDRRHNLMNCDVDVKKNVYFFVEEFRKTVDFKEKLLDANEHLIDNVSLLFR